MIVSVLVILLSGLMFLYWFRYSCRLILETNHARDVASDVAGAISLRLPAVESVLSSAPAAQSASLDAWLAEDLHKLRRLLGDCDQQAASQVDHQMLYVHFSVNQIIYRLTRRFSPRLAAAALREMSQVVHHFANTWGEVAWADSRS